jgi:methylated-DNA-[protein]-cysteine S-methyltransferase
MYYSTIYQSPLGLMTLASDGDNLVGLWLDGQKYHGGTILSKTTTRDDHPIFVSSKRWLDRYFRGEQPIIADLPLAPIGSAFRQSVWQILCQIPYGKTITYREIAQQIANQTGKTGMSSQAVGGAVGHNPISIIIPCHRVIGAKGSLTGYAGGIDVKIKLLELENADFSKLFIPQKRSAI